jgi:hypothetical protein
VKPETARPDFASAQTVATDRSSGERMSPAEAAAWAEAGREITPPKVLERLASHQQFVLSNVTVLGTVLVVLGGAAATFAIRRTTAFAGDVPVVPIGALATTVAAGVAVLVALLSRRVRGQSIGGSGAMSARAYFTNEVAVRGWSLRIATSLLFLAVVLAVATAVTAGVLALVDADRPADEPRNMAALSATTGADGVVTVYLTGAVDGLENDEYLDVDVTSAGDTIVSANVYPDGGGQAELASEALVPAGSTEAQAVITVIRSTDGAVVGSPFVMSASFSAGER